MKRIALALSAALLSLLASTTHAEIKVGDQAKLTYQTVDGKTVDVEKLHGKIVVVDFWATWCGPCMAQASHMVAMNDKYASKGLVMLGVSLDSDKAAMIAVCKDKKFTWPQYFDGKGWENSLWKQWGTNGIPFTVLIDPTGKVVYAGHPANLEPELEATFKNTPPFLVDPKVLADAGKLLDDAEAKITANDPKGALKLMSKVPAAANADGDFAARSKGVQKKLEEAAEAMLGEVEPMVSNGNYTDAVKRLRELSESLAGTPAGTKAKKELGDLMSKPQAKAALAKADKETKDADAAAKAEDLLSTATKLQADKKDAEAYSRFKAVASNYPGTPAAATADEQVKAYDKKNPALGQQANESAVGGKARGALSVAGNYERLGKFDEAKEKYQAIVDAYPGTSYAKTAEEHLAQLPK